MINFCYRTKQKGSHDFINFVDEFTSMVTPQEIDLSLLESGQMDILKLAQKKSLINNIRTKYRAKKFQKIENKIATNENLSNELKTKIENIHEKLKLKEIEQKQKLALQKENKQAVDKILKEIS